MERGRWVVMNLERCASDGVHFLKRRSFAYLNDDGTEWDFAERMNDALYYDDSWEEDEEKQLRSVHREEASKIWNELPEQNRAWFIVYAVMPYENILDIDEEGDEFFKEPHIYTTPFHHRDLAFRDYTRVGVETIDSIAPRHTDVEEATRVDKIPRTPE